jgi:thioredoxin 1
MKTLRIIGLVALTFLMVSYARKFMTGSGSHAASEYELTVTSGADYQKMVLDAEVPVLVDFWAPWCPPCRAMEPILSGLAETYANALHVVKVNVDDNATIAGTYKIESIPTFMIYHRGEMVAQRVGGAREAAFTDWVMSELEKAGVKLAQPAM